MKPDKERLKELREEVCELLRCPMSVWNGSNYEVTNELTDAGKYVLALVDEAIARQSATSGEVAEAIEWHDNQRAGCAVHFNLEKEEKYFELAVLALRQYQKPTAIQWTGNNLQEVIDLVGWNESASSKWTWTEYEQVVAEKGLKIFTPDGSVMAEIGDWIIQNGKDCFLTRQYQKPKLCRLCNDEIDHEDVDLCSACINTLELYQYQKPTDEKIRQAIEWQSSLKDHHQHEWEGTDIDWQMEPGAQAEHDEMMQAFDLAIQALRQMRTEPDCSTAEWQGGYCLGYGRSEQDDEPCEVCKACPKQASYEDDKCEWCDKVLTLFTHSGKYIPENQPPRNYCPNCGRHIGGE